MSHWIKFFVFSTSHGHTGASVAKGDKDDYGIGKCPMRGEVERTGIVQPEKRKLRQDIYPISILLYINI